MAYHIELTENPADYREQIVRMWRDYLPDTPPERYEWLIAGNPAGKTKWFLALDDQTNDLIGFITLLPRRFNYKGKDVLFGIMGDFVVEKQKRGFGPGIRLPKHVLDHAKGLGFSLIYTIPYYGSVKHIERAGFKLKVQLGWLIKPLLFDEYLKNPLLVRFLNTGIRVFDRICNAIFLNPVTLRSSYFKITGNIDNSFEEFWSRKKCRARSILGNRNKDYLTWRYLQNPLVKFQVLVLRDKASEELLGYVIYTIGGGRISIYDIQYLYNKTKILLIQQLIQIARKEGYEAIYLMSSAGDKDLAFLKAFGFVARDEKHSLYCAILEPGLNLDGWRFLQGDRNV